MLMFCCQQTSPQTAILSFNPLKSLLMVNIDLDNAICNPYTDVLVLVPQNYLPPTNLHEVPSFITLQLEKDTICESVGTGFLSAPLVPRGIYYLAYLKPASLYCDDLKCIGKSRPFPYEKAPERSLWVQRNTSFKLPSPTSKKSPQNKNDSVLSGSTYADSSFGSFLNQRSRSLSEEVAEEVGVRDKEIHVSGKKARLCQSEDKPWSILNQYNPVTRSYFKCSIFSPTKQLFAIDESLPFAEDSQPSIKKTRKMEREDSENVISSHESEFVNCGYY